MSRGIKKKTLDHKRINQILDNGNKHLERAKKKTLNKRKIKIAIKHNIKETNDDDRDDR